MKTIRTLLILVVLTSAVATVSCTKKEDSEPIVEQQIVQVLVYRFDITRVKITAFPFLDGGSQWDFMDDADVFFTLNSGSNELYTGFSLAYTDVNYVPVVWNLATPIEINNITNLRVDIRDKDLSGSAFMGNVTFNFIDYISSKPTTFSKTNGNYSVELVGVWN